jgi:serine/threonine protein kinase/Tol biopolymer transport system component
MERVGMSLEPGTQLGPYEVESLIGVGGMGEVYRARDPRLGREVAIKVLPPAFCADDERLRRFQQEARATGQINHPHIVAVHDVGLHAGSPYIVCELLEGDTLRAELRGGSFSARKAIEAGLHIARRLAAAHAKGVVHRDLKPENLFLTTDGRVKILDFGIAKLKAEHSADNVTGETKTGVVVGTVGYMSPEQVRGGNVDHRSDLFAVGAILYELVTGRRAFQADTAGETLAAILRDDPPRVDDTVPGVPRALAAIISHCLVKLPSNRIQSAQDLAFDLELVSTLSERRGSGIDVVPRAVGKKWRPLVVGLGLLGTAMAGALIGRAIGPATPESSTVVAHRLTDFAGVEEYPSLSPDGKSVAFTADADGGRQIWVRLLAGGPPLRLTKDATDHLFPRWAPDSSGIVFFSPSTRADTSGSLWEVSALGGSARRIGASLGGADVSRDGRRLAFFRLNNDRPELVVANRDGSGLETLATLEAGFVYQTPRWSPNDRQIAFERRYFGQGGVLYVADTVSKTVTADLSFGTTFNGLAWLPSGRGLVFSSSRGSTIPYLPTFQLWSRQFGDDEWRQLTFGDGSYVHPDIAADGTLVASRLRTQTDIWRYSVDASGEENVARGLRVTRQTSDVRTPSVSPDDKELAYLSDSGGHGNLWVVNLTDGATRQITFERDPNLAIGIPVWSPRGDRIVYYMQPQAARTPSTIGGSWQIIRSDGSNPRPLIPRGWWASWSPDGEWVYFQDLETPSQLKKVPVDGGPALTVRSDNAVMPVVSPDGGTLFFAVAVPQPGGRIDYEVRFARPENAPAQLLARIPAERIGDGMFHPAISPDGEWLALPLTDGVTANIWAISTRDGSFRALTAFGRRPTFINRRVSWSPSGKFVYAAVSEGDADVFLFSGLRP